MIIAIVSDTHNNIANFNKAIKWLNAQKVRHMLHCGDICNQETINEAVKNFKGEIKFVRGNGDYELYEIPEKMEIILGGKKIFFNHYPDIARVAAESGKYDMVFYGHKHVPWVEQIGNPSTHLTGLGRGSSGLRAKSMGCILANPGELAGQRFKPTFATYDTETDKLELKILEKI